MDKKKIIRIIITLLFAAILFYATIPAINLHSAGFYTYILMVYIFYILTRIINILDLKDIIVNKKRVNRGYREYYPLVLIPIIFCLILVINIILSPLFNSKSYAGRIEVSKDISFTEDVLPVDFSAIPLLDKESSQKLGDRVMGQMPELVSQFYVSELYTQINYNNEIVRVTPLEYAGIIKYFTNRKDGVKGYITVNSVNGEAELVKLDKGMKYMPSGLFNENLSRKLRLSYPTLIFEDISFEIDNEGNPYWIAPIVTYKGIGLRKEITGAVILNPQTGKSKKYDIKDIPTWVDHVYSADLILDQVNDWGRYQDGFLNSMFGQKGVVMTTSGYNYTVMKDDVYLYTGITSVSSDESNIGFILCNMRTKETKYYAVAGAEEYSAMASAEGQVQQMKYKATFPLLINLNNKPTYLISLKDNAGLVKMYAFVDVVDYQKVVVTDSSLGIETARNNYLKGSTIEYNSDLVINKTITIAYIENVIIDNNTYYYIKDSNGQKYKANITVNKDVLPFLGNGSTINIVYLEDANIIEVINITE